MSELVHFSNATEVFDRAVQLFASVAPVLRRALPQATIEHVGSTAAPGTLTKGDVDIAVRVAKADFPRAEERLAAMFARNQGSDRTDEFAAFEDPSTDPPLGIQLVVLGSEADEFVRWRELLRHDRSVREAYDALKRSFHGKEMEAYRKAKREFIESKLGLADASSIPR